MERAEVCSDQGPDEARRRRAAPLPPGERRSVIIDAAIPLLIAQGEAVKTSDIARAAGVAEGTVFRAFETKEALIEAAVAQAMDPVPLEMDIASVDRGGGRRIDDAVTEAVAILQRRVLERWQLLSSVGPRFHHPGRRPSLDSAALTALFAAYGDRLSVDAAEAARHLRAVTFAMTHPMLFERPAAPAEIARLFLHGVGRC